VAGYATAQVSDSDLVAGNIKKNVSILGVTGSYVGEEPQLQSNKTVSPSRNIQYVTPDSGYDGLSQVTVNPCEGTVYISSTSSTNVVGASSAQIDSANRLKLKPENIKSGIKILGVTGEYTGEEPNLESVTIDNLEFDELSQEALVIEKSPGYDGISEVTIEYPENLVPGNILNGVTIMGVTGSYIDEEPNLQSK
jgi:hypothetical protein